jgi:hypothetical protein
MHKHSGLLDGPTVGAIANDCLNAAFVENGVSAPADRSVPAYSTQSECVQHCRHEARPETSGATAETRPLSGRDGASVRHRSRPHFGNGNWQEERLLAHAGCSGGRIRNHYFGTDEGRMTARGLHSEPQLEVQVSSLGYVARSMMRTEYGLLSIITLA